MFGPQDVLVLGILALVFGGAKKIPEMMGGLGKGIREFKKAMDEPEEERFLPPAPESSVAPAPSAQALEQQSSASPSQVHAEAPKAEPSGNRSP